MKINFVLSFNSGTIFEYARVVLTWIKYVQNQYVISKEWMIIIAE
jgi:hypothetical protein